MKLYQLRSLVAVAELGHLTRGAWSALAAMPWITTPLRSSQRQLMIRMFAEHGLEAHKAAEADQEAVKSLLTWLPRVSGCHWRGKRWRLQGGTRAAGWSGTTRA